MRWKKYSADAPPPDGEYIARLIVPSKGNSVQYTKLIIRNRCNVTSVDNSLITHYCKDIGVDNRILVWTCFNCMLDNTHEPEDEEAVYIKCKHCGGEHKVN